MTPPPMTDREMDLAFGYVSGGLVFVLLPATFVVVSLQAGQDWALATLAGLVVGLWADLFLITLGYRKLRRGRQPEVVVHTTTDAIYPGTERPIKIGDRVWGPDGYVSIVQDLVVATQAEDVAHGVQSLWLRRHQVTYAGPPKDQHESDRPTEDLPRWLRPDPSQNQEK